ncbi:MAG: hypothetical protein ACI82I_001659 [Gammaproteobacteria bacterium]|jgi:hypothetical protein
MTINWQKSPWLASLCLSRARSLCSLLIFSFFLSSNVALAQDNWRQWDRMCSGMTEGHAQSEYKGCLNWIVIAPGSFGVAGFAGTPLGMQVSEIPFDQWLVAYRVTKYRDDPFQCGDTRTVRWRDITNSKVAGWGITAAYYTFKSCLLNCNR